MHLLVTQSCLTLRDLTDYSPPGSSVHGNFPGKDTEVGSHSLIQGIFLTQGSNQGLPHGGQILYHLTHHWVGQKVHLGSSIISYGKKFE